MSSLNKVQIIGNLGGDPESRHTQAGTAVTSFSVATSDRWKDKNTGEQKEKTEWHRVVFFGRVAEVAAQYLRKGSSVYVEGQIETSSYEKEGQTHYSTQIKGRELKMLGSRQDGGGQAQGGGRPQGGGQQDQPSRPAPSRPAPSQPALGDDFDDDIPF